MEINKLSGIMSLWDQDAMEPCHDILIPGSPERSLYRVVMRDSQNKLWLLDQIAPELNERKKRIARNLHLLKCHNPSLSLRPYIMNTSQSFISTFQSSFWMLSPYLHAQSLKRPDYLEDGWRGKALANFMIDLHHTVAESVGLDHATDLPSLDHYAQGLAQQIKQFDPSVYTAIQPILTYLDANLFSCLNQLPPNFCHGDLHPENVLWGQQQIISVIDWEFSGPKPELYDLANLMGCMGMEHPSAFEKSMMRELIHSLRQCNFGNPISWSKLKELIICLRLGWMSEWLRKKDQEMIDLEIAYMHLLVNQLTLE